MKYYARQLRRTIIAVLIVFAGCVLAVTLEPAMWAAVKSTWAIGSKVGLFLIQYAVMKSTGMRRARAAMAAAT